MINRKRLLFIAILWVALLPVCSQGQEIHLPKNILTVREIFRQIEDQTSYLISYPARGINPDRKLTFSNTSVMLDDILRQAWEESVFGSVRRGTHLVIVPIPEKEVRQEERIVPGIGFSPLTKKRVEEIEAEQLRMDPEEMERALQAYKTAERIGSEEPVSYPLPFLAVRTNLVYGLAAFTPNGGIETGLAPHSTLLMTGSYNAWRGGNVNKKLWHWTIGAEYRYWLAERYKGHFLGGHAFYGQYNISGKKIPLLLEKGSENYRYEGYGAGIGISYGYQMPLSKQWNLEFNAGIGAGLLHYDKWNCGVCGDRIEKGVTRTFVAPTRLGLSLVYMIK